MAWLFGVFSLVALCGGAAAVRADPEAAALAEPETASSLPGPAGEDAWIEALNTSEPTSYPDPLERGNRVVFSFNDALDRFALGPLADAYGWVVPAPAERAIARAFQNLSEPASLVNHVLQAHPVAALATLARFCVNSTLGVVGLFEVARSVGLPARSADFGMTLHRWGVPSGPYLVLPLLGPATARDWMGDLVDDVVAPQRYLLSRGQQLVLGTSYGIAARHENADALEALREGAVDFYAALRTAYYLSRESELRRGEPGPSASLRSSAETSASKPSRSSAELYSARRSASSDTVPPR
jgi:phospholipid-binding lipoprotein MlaA